MQTVLIPMSIWDLTVKSIFAAHGTMSWAGAWCWCQKYDDGYGIASGNVGWGGIQSGSWEAIAAIEGSGGSHTNSGSISDQGKDPNPSGEVICSLRVGQCLPHPVV